MTSVQASKRKLLATSLINMYKALKEEWRRLQIYIAASRVYDTAKTVLYFLKQVNISRIFIFKK